MAKTEHFWIRAEKDWRDRLKALAVAAGVSEAEMVRRLVDAESKRQAKSRKRER